MNHFMRLKLSLITVSKGSLITTDLSWVDVAEEDFMWYPVYQLNDETRASAEQFKKEKEKKRREGVVDEKEQDDEENFVLPAVTYSSTSANSTVRKGLVNGKDRKGNFIYDVEDILEYRKIGGVDKYRLQFANVVKERRCWYAESSLRGCHEGISSTIQRKGVKARTLCRCQRRASEYGR